MVFCEGAEVFCLTFKAVLFFCTEIEVEKKKTQKKNLPLQKIKLELAGDEDWLSSQCCHP